MTTDRDGVVAIEMEEMHAALARALGIELGRGSYAQVADTLLERGVPISRQRYTDVRKGRAWTLDTIERWCRTAGVPIHIVDGRVTFGEQGAP